jgi:hypothetical protein
LCVNKTTPDDMTALKLVQAIITTTGGYTSHSAVVARQLGKPCIVSYQSETPNTAVVTVDGTNGIVYEGTAQFAEPEPDEHMEFLLSQADKAAQLRVLTNADTSEDFAKALNYGAKGIGLCRTEHTFFSESGVAAILRFIFANTSKHQKAAIEGIYQAQRAHFESLFKAGLDKEYTIRLLDPPLHEFLPSAHDKNLVHKTAKMLKLSQKVLIGRINKLHEENPMLGHRGCRLGITAPALYQAQLRALFDAATASNFVGELNVMIPLIASVREARELHGMFMSVKQHYHHSDSIENAKFGVMLETPRACLQTYELAEFCDFFSFGTNDLTQAMWMLSRDDSMSFMPTYIERDIESDPFQSLDMDGVGKMMAIAVESLGDRRSKVKIGICGEHGGDPRSIAFCHALGLDYVSCSPPRVLVARIAAAHANASPADTFSVAKVDLPELVNTNLSEEVIESKTAVKDVKPFANIPPLGAVTGFNSVDYAAGVPPVPKTDKPVPKPVVADVPLLPMLQFKHMAVLEQATPVVEPKTPDIPVPWPNTQHAGTVKVPTWVKAAKIAPVAYVGTMIDFPSAMAVKAAAGYKVGIKGGKKHPEWGVVVGYVEAPFLMMYVLAVDDPLGHDGKNMKTLIKYEIATHGLCPLWLVTPEDITHLPSLQVDS